MATFWLINGKRNANKSYEDQQYFGEVHYYSNDYKSIRKRLNKLE